MSKVIHIPLPAKQIRSLKTQDRVSINGDLYTARDAALARLNETWEEKGALPLDLSGRVIYFSGPSPAPPGKVIGSVGPTTSSRLARFIPFLLERGVKGIIGKGALPRRIVGKFGEEKAVYFITVGGAGAFLAQKVEGVEVVLYEDLGPEAIYKLMVKDFPAIVAIDSEGKSLFQYPRFPTYPGGENDDSK